MTLADGSFILSATADGGNDFDLVLHPTDAGSQVYLDAIILESGVSGAGGSVFEYTVPMKIAAATVTTFILSPNVPVWNSDDLAIIWGAGQGSKIVPLFHVAPGGVGQTVEFVGGSTDGRTVRLTVVGSVGPPLPVVGTPSLLVAGVSGGQAIPVTGTGTAGAMKIDSTTPVQVQGKAGGFSLPVNVDSITIDHVTVNDPMPIKTSGTDVVKVIPG